MKQIGSATLPGFAEEINAVPAAGRGEKEEPVPLLLKTC
jgi:hypothetical protein